MVNKQIYNSGALWEPIVGYSRAIRIGNLIEVSGTTAVDEDGQVIGRGNAGEQTRYILEKIGTALEALGAGYENVIRTRIYVTDISQWEAIGRAHGKVFGTILPATSMIEVKSLIDPALLVEIEVTAVMG